MCEVTLAEKNIFGRTVNLSSMKMGDNGSSDTTETTQKTIAAKALSVSARRAVG